MAISLRALRRPLRRTLLSGIIAAFVLLSLCAISAAQTPVTIAPGTTHTQIYRPEGPWVIHVVEADLSEEFLELEAVLGGGEKLRRGQLSQMVAGRSSEQRRPVAAVNGDFFALAGGAYAGIPLGFHVEDGELVTFPDAGRSVLYVLEDGTVGIDRFRANGWLAMPGEAVYPVAAVNRPPEYSDLVVFTPRFGEETRAEEATTQISLVGVSGPIRPSGEVTGQIASIGVAGIQRIPPEGMVLAARGVAAYALRSLRVGEEVRLRFEVEPDEGEIRTAVGGGPRLVREGRVSVENRGERFSDGFASTRHPRTGVGVREGRVVMVTVDGRQPGYSAGMTLEELARVFVELGCTEAMNLDGGGSTTMVVRSRVVNSPSGGVERAVANGLALFSTAPTGPPAMLSLEPVEANVLGGETLRLTAGGLDQYYNPVGLPPEGVLWDCAGSLGEVDEEGMFHAAEVRGPTAGLVTAHCGTLMAALVVRVLPGPARLVIAPARLTLAPGEVQQFAAQAYDLANRPVQLPAGRVVWNCEPGGAEGWITPSGRLVAPPRPGGLTVVARVGEISARAAVQVGEITAVVWDFEEPDSWAYGSTPPGLPGGVEVVEDPRNGENHCLRLRYDFSGVTVTRAAHAQLNLRLPETPTMSVRVMGDSQGAWLRARLRDGAARAFAVSLADHVDWPGEWRRLTARLPAEAAPPVTLESVYVTEYHGDRAPAGEIYLDDIGVCTGEESAEPPAAPAAEDLSDVSGEPAAPVEEGE